ncbi:AAA family ATPase [Thalassotalea sp. LPB0316]|nr:AAA family ATPase [Thalassotalea sp. LPB0316]
MNGRLQILDEFLTRWPREKIKELSLDEYIDVNNQDTFAYWLEHKTKPLGSIRGGDASKFGIYRRNKEPKGERSHIQHGDSYSWNRKFGSSEIEAFENVKSNILKVIEFVDASDLNSIEALELADTLKWKIAFLYQDHNFPVLLNIFKKDVLQKACGNSSAGFAELYKELMAKRADKNVVEYGYEVWNQIDKDAITNDDEFDEETVLPEETASVDVSLNTILYGPPGTGKTYSTINKALEIIAPDFYKVNKSDRQLLKERFDSLVKSNRVGFVTFHQSFSYEDFVEGIKAATNENNQVSYEVEDGIFKQMCDAASSKVKAESVDSDIDVSSRKIWKMSLGNTLGEDAYIFEECIENSTIALGYGGAIDFTSAVSRKDIAELYRSNGYTIDNESFDFNVSSVIRFKNEMAIGDLVIVSDGNHKFRAIAEITGDYYFQKSNDGDYSQLREVKWLKQFSPSLPVSELFNKNLSQQTIYRLKPPTIDKEKLQLLLASTKKAQQVAPGTSIANYKVNSITREIIEFEKPNGSRLPIAMSIVNELVHLVKSGDISIEDIKHKRVFDKVDTNMEKYLINGYPNVFAPLIESVIKRGIATDALNTSDARVLIIDEINRGNIANIFGELITLIEPSKRTGGSETISVKLPYSKTSFSVPSNLYLIGTMNTADKSLAQVDIALRRRFEFIEMMTDYEILNQIPKINGIDVSRVVQAINSRIELLYDREHTIGHSFFIPLISEPTLEKLASIFELQILPLLEEYFFEDWERVGQVLGDHLKQEAQLRFIIEKFDSSEIANLMGNDWELNGVQPYTRNSMAFKDAKAFIGIYE